MKKILIAILALPLLFACGGNKDEKNPVVDSLNQVTSGLSKANNQKDSTILSFLKSFNDIQENLDQIKEKQKLIAAKGSAELQKTPQDQIIADIQLINELMEKNKKTIGAMQSKLKKANVKIEELEKTIAGLMKQIEEKDGEITSLKDQLEKANAAYKDLFAEYNTRVEEVDQQTKKLNTAYYAFGTAKELIAHGVLTKEGGFIGMGKSTKLKEDFNKEYFTKIDINETKSIPLGGKKVKLVTTHPKTSYKLEGPENKIEKIEITAPEEFWGASKYLVIVTE